MWHLDSAIYPSQRNGAMSPGPSALPYGCIVDLMALVRRPRPSSDPPPRCSLLQRKRRGCNGLHLLTIFRERKGSRYDCIGAITGNDDLTSLADSAARIGHAIFLGKGIVILCPVRARTRTVPLVRGNIIHDGGIIGASRGCFCRVGVIPLIQHRHDVASVRG